MKVIPRLEDVTSIQKIDRSLWNYAPEAFLVKAEKALERKVPTALAIGTYDGKRYWLLLHVGLTEYIEDAIEK
jgi:DNA polymerase IIIc chi subunit